MSTPPPDYDRQYNFENWQTINPSAPLPAQHIEAEFNAIENSVNSTISRLNEIQEQDGTIKLSQENLNLIGDVAETAANVAAQNKCDEYFAENYDPTIVTSAEAYKNQAQSAAVAAAASAVAAESSKNDAAAHALAASVNASSASNFAQAAEGSSDACLAAVDFVGNVQQSVTEKETNINQTYSASLQLKNWVESQAYKFVHKREDLNSVAVNMMYNQGDVQNATIGQFFPNTFFNENSVVSVDPLQYGASKWKRAHKENPEPVVNIMHRDMMGTLAMTWRLFHGGQWSEAGQGYGSPTFASYWTPVLPCFYDADFSPGATSLLNTDVNGISNALDAALCPVKYAKELIADLAAPIVHTHVISDVVGLQDALDNAGSGIDDYDNFKVYNAGDIVHLSGKLYRFNVFIGAAGYGPITHPAAWTKLTSSEIADINGLQSGLDGKANLSGDTFTGNVFLNVPTGPIKIEVKTGGGLVPEYKTTVTPSMVTVGFSDGFNAYGVYSREVAYVGAASVGSAQMLVSNTLAYPPRIELQEPVGSFTGFFTKIESGKFYANDNVGSGWYEPYASLSGASFTGKVSGSSVSGKAGINIGIGGTSTDATTPGDLWIVTGGTSLNFRDGTGAWRQCISTSSAAAITTTSVNPVLTITQNGSGRSFVVQDGSSNPDTDCFIIDNSGNLGVGVSNGASPWVAAHKVEVNGAIKANSITFDGTAQFKVNSVSSHGSGANTHDLYISHGGSTYRIPMIFVSTP